jgi:hypothetical protein
MTYATGRWYHDGQRVLQPTPALIERLQHTEIRGIRAESVRMPYPSCAITLPANTLRMWSESDGRWVDLRQIYVVEDTPLHAHRTLHVVAVGTWTYLNSNVYDDSVAFISIRMDPKALVVQGVMDSLAETEISPENVASWHEIITWLMNLLLYATSRDVRQREAWRDPRVPQLRERVQRLPKGSPKRKKASQQLAQCDQRRKLVLGIGLPRLTSDEPNEPRRKLNRATVVIGHWRQQACGPQHSERRLTWIAPYLKGSLDAGHPMQSTTHIVK